MNSIIGLVVGSLLVLAMVAIAIPNAIEAKQPHQWCIEGTVNCFDNKGDCLKTHKQGAPTNTCVKTPT